MLCGVPGAKWVEENQIHLTLRFIGEVDGGLKKDVMESLAGVRAEPFSLTLKGVGHFPPRKDPHTIWVRVEPADELIVLRGRVESALAAAGIERDNRKFYPHVRLASLKNTRLSKVVTYLTEHSLFEAPPFVVSEFCLFSSYLGSHGAIHQVEAAYELSAKGVENE